MAVYGNYNVIAFKSCIQKLTVQVIKTQQLFCVQAKYCVQINGTQEIQNQPLCSVQAKYCELNDE